MSSRNKAQRAAALEKFKAARRGGGGGGGRLNDDDDVQPGHNNDNDDDIYETVTEEEYVKIVNARRQREDFVVDDDGLGYYDDGEELLGDEANYNENNNNNKKRGSINSTAALTSKALKKARLNHQHSMAMTSESGGGTTTSKNASMWDFVNRGSATSSSTEGKTTNTKLKSSRSSSMNKPSVEDLLGQLDDPLLLSASLTRKSRNGNTNSRSRNQLHRGGGGSRSRNSNRHQSSAAVSNRYSSTLQYSSSSKSRAGSINNHNKTDYTENDNDHGFNMATDNHDDDDNIDDGHGDNNTAAPFWDNRDDHPNENVTSMAIDDSPKPIETTSSSSSNEKKSVTFREDDTAETSMDIPETVESNNAIAATTSQQRRRLAARSKLGQMSKAAADAIQQQDELEKSKQQKQEANDIAITTIDAATKSSSTFVDTTSASFHPLQIANEVSLPSSTAGQLDLPTYLKSVPSKSTDGTKKLVDGGDDDTTNPVESSSYIDMYWMDLCERGNGDLLVFGKVWYDKSYISTCVLVTGNVRSLFVLPKSTDTNMMDVHGEIGKMLHEQHILPRAAGVSWKGKPVKRNYAFGDSSIPRTVTDYLKVVYDAKYPVPAEDICMGGGKTFSKILGAGASLVENFIVKRKLMGPCWVRIQNPQPVNGSLSWCKLECRMDCPKNMTRLDLVIDDPTKLPVPPPFVTLSIKLKTVVNPKTHKSEIVSVSAVCHKNVLLETTSDDTSKYLTQLSLIRPLATEGSNGTAQFPRDIDEAIASGMPQLRRETNERALLSRLLAQVGQWDPDVIVGHNIWGYDMEVILSRCLELKVPSWSRVGRRRRTELPSKAYFSSRKDMAIADAMSGRLLCDTYLSAQELLRETTYSLSNLSATQLKISRQEIEPVDIPLWYKTSKTIVNLAQSTLFDAQLVQKLMFKLQVLPLTKQLTCIAGNIWTHTLKGNRAERTEYLLLHEFHRLKYIPPEKKRYSGKKFDQDNSTRSKAKYSGGLVLEPKKGLYESFILLLDFNSLYPSLIQEYNLCFTTMNWSTFQTSTDDVTDADADIGALPNLPDPSVDQGVLPRVIKSLVDRRRAVKGLMKNERILEKKQELDIRQLALKLTANSMYGCLGFSNSRFYAQPIAALVTSKGRETLQRSVDIAQNTVGLEVIYGDTDSIMINTRISDEKDLKKVKELGERVKKEVNRLYRTLELEIDGIFRTMLLLKKKKYAARTVEELPDGTIKYGQELKGLDLVRRDWCIQSKDTGRFVTEQILSGEDSEEVLEKIHSHLEELAKKMRAGDLPLEKYVITKGLSKHPNDYPDGNALPHVYVAKMMLKDNRLVNTGDHIPYIITAPIEKDKDAATEEQQQPHVKAGSATQRARHPDDIARSNGLLKPDIEWYLTQQILPPISRLCEPIDGTSQQLLAEKLGLDSKRYNGTASSSNNNYNSIDGEIDLDYVPESLLSDDERFKDVNPLMISCVACGTKSAFPGVFAVKKDDSADSKSSELVSGLRCTNPNCIRPIHWGRPDYFQCYSYIVNSISIWIRELSSKYYSGTIQCDEPSCGLITRQLSVCGGSVCLQGGCGGRMYSVSNEQEVHRHHKYLETLFNIDHACEQKRLIGDQRKEILSPYDDMTYKELHSVAKKELYKNAYNFISPSFWHGLMPISSSTSAVVKQ